MTRDELVALFVKKKARETALSWAQFSSAIGSLSLDEKNQILLAINNESGNALASLVMAVAKSKKHELAASAVNALIADNSLTIDELLTLVD